MKPPAVRRSIELDEAITKRRNLAKFSVSSSLEDYGIHKFSTWGSAASFFETTVDHAYQDAMYDEFKLNGHTKKLKQLQRERKEVVKSVSSMRVYKGDVYIFIEGIGYWTRLL